MFNDAMYLSAPQISCYDGEGDAAAAAAAASAKADADKAAADKAAADAGKTFDQTAVNQIVEERLARDRKSRETENKAKYEDLQTKHETLLANKNLSDEERTKLEGSLDDVRNQLRTKEERAKHEKKQLETSYEEQLQTERKARKTWEDRFHDSSISRALQDAAVGNEAYSSDQIIRLLKPMTSLKPVVDEATEQETGNFKTVVDFPDHDEKGLEVTFSGTPDEIVKRMKDLEPYQNLFKSNVVAGVGSTNNATGGTSPGSNGQIDVRNISEEQYAKIRKENPELLGL